MAKQRVVVLTFVTVFLDLVGFGVIVPLLPFYVRSMGGTPETVGLLFASFSVAQMGATPIMGRLSDRFGRRRVMTLSLAGNAASMLLFAAASESHALLLLFVSRTLAGITAGNVAACSAAVADVTTGTERARALGRIGAAVSLGLVLGPALGAVVVQLGPSAPPLAAAAFALLDLLAVSLLMPETRSAAEHRQEVSAPAPRVILADTRIRRPLAVLFLTGLCTTTFQATLPLLASERLGWTERDVGSAFALFGLVGLLVQGLLVGPLIRRLGSAPLVVAGAFCAAAGLAMLAGARSGSALLGGVSLLGLGVAVVSPVASALTSERTSEAGQGLVLGFAQSCGSLARVVGPLGAGLLFARLGPGAPFVGGAVTATLALTIGTSLP